MAIQKLKKLYRTNYAGENIVTQLSLIGGEWNPETEYIPNSVTYTHTSTQAIAIGNGESRANFNIKFITNHQGGVLAENKLQTYACNAAYRDFTPNFLIATGDIIIDEIANSGYCTNNIVYTNVEYLLKYPGKFYLIPQNILFDAGAIAAYMACFDGHTKVFLIGYDMYDMEGPTNNIYKDTNGYLSSNHYQNGEFFALSLYDVISTYPDVEFIRVMPFETHWVHSKFDSLVNFRQITYTDFVYEADIGVMNLATT